MPEDLPAERRRTAEAYRAWAGRAGTQEAAFSGDAGWTPERRFARVFERLALPGFGRARRFDLLTALGAAGRYELEAGELFLGSRTTRRRWPPSACWSPATGCCSSAARASSPRRARLPLAALDRGLAVWGTQGAPVDLAGEPPAAVRAALALR